MIQLLDPWRKHLNCLFGLSLSGTPSIGVGTGATGASCPQIDRLRLEATVGWDATVNGNLAEQLQEPR